MNPASTLQTPSVSLQRDPAHIQLPPPPATPNTLSAGSPPRSPTPEEYDTPLRSSDDDTPLYSSDDDTPLRSSDDGTPAEGDSIAVSHCSLETLDEEGVTTDFVLAFPDNASDSLSASQLHPLVASAADIWALEYQLGCNILQALELVERLAVVENRSAELWSPEILSRACDILWHVALQRDIEQDAMGQDNREDNRLQVPLSHLQDDFTPTQIANLGWRFSRAPSTLNPVVHSVWANPRPAVGLCY
ncbi:hypothetical protein NMY22_g19948 [Coprinellus aureogranulatus]|nr:hypothetical protein NMY22_g19948 [Coprinellus aureogranulatus]